MISENTLLRWNEPALFHYRTLRPIDWFVRLAVSLVLPTFTIALLQATNETAWCPVIIAFVGGLCFMLGLETFRNACITKSDLRVGPRHSFESTAQSSWPFSLIERVDLYRRYQHELADAHPVLVLHGRYRRPEVIGMSSEREVNAAFVVLSWKGVSVALHEAEGLASP